MATYTEMYQKAGDTKPWFIVRASDGVSIPVDLDNVDYQNYLKWKSKNLPASDIVNPIEVAVTATAKVG